MPTRNNPVTQAAYSKRRKAEFNQRIRAIKESTPCADCGGSFHFSAMDFDHIEDNKLFGVAMFGGTKWEKIQAEIDKCEIVCSNCHRVRTWKRKQVVPS